MNRLHCFWGVGVMASPIIMSVFLSQEGGTWRNGYRAVAVIQLAFGYIATGTTFLIMPIVLLAVCLGQIAANNATLKTLKKEKEAANENTY